MGMGTSGGEYNVRNKKPTGVLGSNLGQPWCSGPRDCNDLYVMDLTTPLSRHGNLRINTPSNLWRFDAPFGPYAVRPCLGSFAKGSI
jgi:hypothetical protein